MRRQLYNPALYEQPQSLMAKIPVQPQQQQLSPLQQQPQVSEKPLNVESLNMQGLDLNAIEQETLVLKDEAQNNLLTASILQQFQNSTQINTIRAAYVGSPVIYFYLLSFIFSVITYFCYNTFGAFLLLYMCCCLATEESFGTV